MSSIALVGLEGRQVQVEVDFHHGLPRTNIVGLPDAAVRESKDRLFAALRNCRYTYPDGRVTINLSPANLRKAGPRYDLPMALGLLACTKQGPCLETDTAAIGEIGLDGALRPVTGVLSVAQAAKALGHRRVIVPKANGAEAALIEGIEVLAPEDLRSLVAALEGRVALEAPTPTASGPDPDPGPDLAAVRGQGMGRRALEIAAAGGHNLLFTGPPGAGKTFLARCLPSILPSPTRDECLEITALYSVAGALPRGPGPLIQRRPFRSPHHTISPTGLVGGGAWPKPGELSLAHRGVLFLDEMPEFDRRCLESLRGPLDDRQVTISRAAGRATYPAAFALVAARNPCPCGHFDSEGHRCRCTAHQIDRYTRKISGPILDRFDLHLVLPAVPSDQLLARAPSTESSATVRARVEEARRRQIRRLGPGGAGRPSCNADLPASRLHRDCRLDHQGRALIRRAMENLDLSARAYHRTLKVARTLADLDGAGDIQAKNVSEALQFRTPPGH